MTRRTRGGLVMALSLAWLCLAVVVAVVLAFGLAALLYGYLLLVVSLFVWLAWTLEHER